MGGGGPANLIYGFLFSSILYFSYIYYNDKCLLSG